MPLTDDEYERYAGYILAAARVHPEDCTVTLPDLIRSLKDNDQIRASIIKLQNLSRAQPEEAP